MKLYSRVSFARNFAEVYGNLNVAVKILLPNLLFVVVAVFDGCHM